MGCEEVRIEVFTELKMCIVVFWNVMSRGLVGGYRHLIF